MVDKKCIDITEFSVKHDENGNFTISDQYEGKIYLIDWEKGTVRIRDYWDEDFFIDEFQIERWFEMLLRREE